MQKKYTEAEGFLKEALETSEKNFKEDHNYVSASINNLAIVYQEQGKYKDAELLFERSLKINESLLAENHPFIGTNINNLAVSYEKTR